MTAEHWWNDSYGGRHWYSKENLYLWNFVHHKFHVTTLVSKLGHRSERPVGQPGGISVPFPTFPILGVRAQSPSRLIKEPAPLIIIVVSRLAAAPFLLFLVCLQIA
jgi:hypothetical protein